MEEKRQITLGVPRSLLFYKYRYFWESFFGDLGIKLVYSPKTNKKILEDGVELSVDENCLPVKLYLGHVKQLIGKVDFFLVPRLVSLEVGQQACTKFNATYDILANTFPGIPMVEYTIDLDKKLTEEKEMVRVAILLGAKKRDAKKAFRVAKEYQASREAKDEREQHKILQNKNGKLKILIVSHPYNIYDEHIGKPILEYLENLDVDPIMADLYDEEEAILLSKKLSERLYWTANKELLGALEFYRRKVDGIIFIVTFPCGPDSLVAELVSRKLKNIPLMTLILDEHQGEAGLRTRLESFVDITKMKKVRDGK